jgi:hypothetical protein
MYSGKIAVPPGGGGLRLAILNQYSIYLKFILQVKYNVEVFHVAER